MLRVIDEIVVDRQIIEQGTCNSVLTPSCGEDAVVAVEKRVTINYLRLP